MAKYVPSPRDWVREQVELYESSGGTKGTTLRDTGLPVVIVTHRGNKTGAIRKTPLMRVKEGDHYILVGSQGGAPKNPTWVHNLRADPRIELRDETIVRPMRVCEVTDAAERARLWTMAVTAYPPYAEYQARTKRCRRAVISGRDRWGKLREGKDVSDVPVSFFADNKSGTFRPASPASFP